MKVSQAALSAILLLAAGGNKNGAYGFTVTPSSVPPPLMGVSTRVQPTLLTRGAPLSSVSVSDAASTADVDNENESLEHDGRHPSSVASVAVPPLPPSRGRGLKPSGRGLARRRRASAASSKVRKEWNGPSIPKSVPKLSELIEDGTVGMSVSGDWNDANSNESFVAEELNKSKLPVNVRDSMLRRHSKAKNGSQHTEKPAREPWRAGYFSSTRTQSRIKAAADVRGSRLERATSVLSTFLEAPPEWCNEVNVMCALTLSAKVLNNDRSGSPAKRSRFRALLFRTLDVLHMMVDEKRLSIRQLCNAAWAVAKHFVSDHTILPPQVEQTALSDEVQTRVAEKWDLNQADSPEYRIQLLLDSISSQLIELLSQEGKESKRAQVKPGELCMACWAYAVVRPRTCPPGWALPPRAGRLPGSTRRQALTSKTSDIKSDGKSLVQKNGDDFITFEQWDDFSSQTEPALGVSAETGKDNSDTDSTDVTDRLFDVIAETFCHEDEADVGSASKCAEENDQDGAPPPVGKVSQCTWSELANVAWAYATHGHYNTEASTTLMLRLGQEATRRLDEYGSDVSWEGKNGDLIANSQGKNRHRPRRILARDVAEIAWALGALQSDNFRLGDSLVELVKAISCHWLGNGHSDSNGLLGEKPGNGRPFQHWTCPDLVQLAVALAHGRIDDTALLQALYNEAHLKLKEEEGGNHFQHSGLEREAGGRAFQSWELAVLLWVQARLYLTSKQGKVFDDFASTAPKVLIRRIHDVDTDASHKLMDKIGLGPQEQANLAWSLTVLEQYDNSESQMLLKNVFEAASSADHEKDVIQLEHAHQLWQALFLLRKDCPDAVKNVPTWFSQYLQEKWNAEKSRRKLSSARHRSLSQLLELMGVAHYNEHDEDIDVAIVLKEESSWTHRAEKSGSMDVSLRVAVEFDGPHHFTRDEGMPQADVSVPGQQAKVPRALGHTVLKYRLLKRQGWTVVRVPYYEFDKIPFWASMERQRYLQRLLKTHANIRFSEIDVSEYKAMVANRKSRFD